MKNLNNTCSLNPKKANYMEPIATDSLFDNQIWMDSNQAASYLSITVNSLRIRICRGELNFYKLGRRLRFKKEDLDRLIRTSI